ncbi:MAG: histidinol dehydrogenase [Armatimonadetes bacterium]|nr:histidinol dehydrogenase [Armatimonadota bacterium]
MSDLLRLLDARRDPEGVWLALEEMAPPGLPELVVERAAAIVEDVRERGDEAVVEYTRQFDWPAATVEGLVVGEDEIEAAFDEVDREWLRALRRAKDNLYRYHERQAPRSWLQPFDGLLLGQHVKPVAAAGLHVPGRTAPLPSTVIHSAVPAAVAGVPRLVMVSPPRQDGTVSPERLVAASECGISEVYRIGGAQAIAALAFGTETIQPVDKVVGPGNPYATAAKQLVSGIVGVDSPAGPSEAVIVTDGSVEAELVAVDLLTQAEHTGDNLVLLLSTDEALVEGVIEQLDELLNRLDRDEIIRRSLEDCGAAVLVESVQQAMDLVNDIAPEHLQLLVEDPFGWLSQVQACGAVFLGPSSPVPLGDYAAGPSHVLPTGRAARFASGLSVLDFVTFTSVISASAAALEGLAEDVIVLAEAEGLDAHAEALRYRLRRQR